MFSVGKDLTVNLKTTLIILVEYNLTQKNNFDLQKGNALQAVLVEGGIILFLVVIVLVALNYANVINIGALLPGSQPQPVKNIQTNQNVNKNAQQKKPASNSAGFNMLQTLAKNKALHYSYTVTEYEATIKTIDTKEGIIPGTKMKYYTAMTLVAGSSTPLPLYIPSEAMSKLTVNATSKDGKLSTIKITDLKEGDKIVVKVNTGNLRQYPNAYNSITLTKL